MRNVAESYGQGWRAGNGCQYCIMTSHPGTFIPVKYVQTDSRLEAKNNNLFFVQQSNLLWLSRYWFGVASFPGSSLLPRNRAGQRSHVKLLWRREEEPGNEACLEITFIPRILHIIGYSNTQCYYEQLCNFFVTLTR